MFMDFRNDRLLLCGFINIQSVGNKTIEIRQLIAEQCFDVFAIAETWLNDFDHAKIHEMTPFAHSFLHIPRVGKWVSGVGIFALN